MNFLKSDLTRNFAIGFLAGALIMLAQIGPDLIGSPIPAAAAETVQ
nr:hypothetical protein [Parerythrobacter lutipelagi]